MVAVARPLVARSWVHPTPRLKRHAVKTYGFQTTCVRLGKKIETVHGVGKKGSTVQRTADREPRRGLRLFRPLHHVEGKNVQGPPVRVLLEIPNILSNRNRSWADGHASGDNDIPSKLALCIVCSGDVESIVVGLAHNH